jgi:Ribbon-helix-helix protein, copG family
MVKVTFTLDDATVARLRHVAARTNKPQSQVVREAVRDYADRAGRLTEAERLRMLGAIDTMMRRKPTRPHAEVERELRDVRAARRHGGRRHGS